jgi:hypothetical protein
LEVASVLVYVPEFATVEKSPSGVVERLTAETVSVNEKVPVSPSGSVVVPPKV